MFEFGDLRRSSLRPFLTVLEKYGFVPVLDYASHLIQTETS